MNGQGPGRADVTSQGMPALQEGALPSGPWEQAFWVALPVAPCSKSNHRRYRHGAAGADRWDRFAAFETVLAATVSPQRVGCPWPLHADRALPQRPVVALYLYARTTIDTLNLSKSVGDALEGVLYANDASVLAALAASTRTRRHPGLLLSAAWLPPGAGHAAAAAAAAGLAAEMGARADTLVGGGEDA